MSILIRQKDGNWRQAEVIPYVDECHLQNMLYKSPELIPVRDGSNIAPVFIREAGLPGSGSTDLIGVDSNGEIYIVECKLATNPEIRREVIGQILEYAAFLWQMPYEDFDRLFAKRKEKTLKESFAEKMPEGWECDVFRTRLTENLKNGNFHLIIAVDQMNEQLQEIIAYLCRDGAGVRLQSIELQLHSEGDTEVLVPQLHPEFTSGGEGRKRVSWDYQGFLADADQMLKQEEVKALRSLYE